jgi:ABC-type transport system involved in multi-copper enzyme maturation permease subunit
LMVAMVTPAICGGLVSREIEGGTYDLLLVTPVKGRTLIYGKLIGAVGYLFVLIMATLPLTCIVFIFGGVSPADIITGYAIVLMEAVVLGIISLFFSAVFRLTNVAVIFTYFIIALLLLGVPVVSSSLTASINADTDRVAGNSFRVDPRTDPDFDLPKRLMVLNPFAALGSVLAPNAPYRPSNGEDLQMFPNSRLYWGNPTAYYGTPTFLPNTSARQRYEDSKLPVLPYGLALWQGYLLVYTAIGLVFLILSMGAVKPLPGGLIYYPVKGLNFLRKTLPNLTKKGRWTIAAAQIAPLAVQPAEISPVITTHIPEAKKPPEVETTGEISQADLTAGTAAPLDPPQRHREALG